MTLQKMLLQSKKTILLLKYFSVAEKLNATATWVMGTDYPRNTRWPPNECIAETLGER